MDPVAIATLLIALASAGGTLLAFVVSLPGKIDGAITKRLDALGMDRRLLDYYTKFDIVTQYVSRVEHERHAGRIEVELKNLRKVMFAIARRMNVPLDELEDE